LYSSIKQTPATISKIQPIPYFRCVESRHTLELNRIAYREIVMAESVKTIRVAAADAPAVEADGEWGSAVWLANKSLTGSSISVLRLLLHPRHSARKHRHANADEVLCLIRGQVRVHAGNETQALQPGDSLSIPAGLVHQIENVGSDNAEMTIAYSTGERAYE
jgi:quercetin dioxygenase-like cupin family protein